MKLGKKTSKSRKTMYTKSSKPKDMNMTKISKLVSKSVRRSFILSKVEDSDDSVVTGANCVEAAKSLSNSLAATEEGALVLALDDALRAAGYFGTKEHQLASKAYGKLTEGRQLLNDLIEAIESDMEEKASKKKEQENFTKDLPQSTADGSLNDVDINDDEDDIDDSDNVLDMLTSEEDDNDDSVLDMDLDNDDNLDSELEDNLNVKKDKETSKVVKTKPRVLR